MTLTGFPLASAPIKIKLNFILVGYASRNVSQSIVKVYRSSTSEINSLSIKQICIYEKII